MDQVKNCIKYEPMCSCHPNVKFQLLLSESGSKVTWYASSEVAAQKLDVGYVDNDQPRPRPLHRPQQFKMRAARHLVARTRALRTLSTSTIARSHLNPSVPTTALGLPTSPLPSLIPTVPSTPLNREKLHKLCHLAALNPPPEGSEAETKLLAELGELIGLMDLVSSVELEGDVGDLLSAGVGEYVIGEPREREPVPEGQEEGRRLLQYATRRVGDYYGVRVEDKKE
jgi:hypothetical protein